MRLQAGSLPTLFTAFPSGAVIMAAQPTGINAYLFAQRYGICLATATTTVFLSTAFSIISLSALLYLLEVR